MLQDRFNFFKSIPFTRGHNPKLGVRGEMARVLVRLLQILAAA